MASYNLTLYYDQQQTLKALPGPPSRYSMTSVVAVNFTFGGDTAVIHCANFDATPHEIQQMARRLLSEMK
jgi:hypothetical protein